MASPTLTRAGGRIYEALSPLATLDPENGWHLAHYVSALARMIDRPADWGGDQEDGTPGWALLFDPDTAPEEALEWLAQFVGVTLPPHLTAAQKRERIKSTDGFRRGSAAAMRAAPLPYLTGNKIVYMSERWGGDPYHVRVATITEETPDPLSVANALLEQKPAGVVLTYQVVDATDFDALRDTHVDFDDVALTFVDFNEVRENPTKQREG